MLKNISHVDSLIGFMSVMPYLNTESLMFSIFHPEIVHWPLC